MFILWDVKILPSKSHHQEYGNILVISNFHLQLHPGKAFTSGIPPLVQLVFLQISQRQAGVKIAGINAEAPGLKKDDFLGFVLKR